MTRKINKNVLESSEAPDHGRLFTITLGTALVILPLLPAPSPILCPALSPWSLTGTTGVTQEPHPLASSPVQLMFSSSRRWEGRRRERLGMRPHFFPGSLLPGTCPSSVEWPHSLSLLLLLRPKGHHGLPSQLLTCRGFTVPVVSLLPASPSQIKLPSAKPLGCCQCPHADPSAHHNWTCQHLPCSLQLFCVLKTPWAHSSLPAPHLLGLLWLWVTEDSQDKVREGRKGLESF